MDAGLLAVPFGTAANVDAASLNLNELFAVPSNRVRRGPKRLLFSLPRALSCTTSARHPLRRGSPLENTCDVIWRCSIIKPVLQCAALSRKTFDLCAWSSRAAAWPRRTLHLVNTGFSGCPSSLPTSWEVLAAFP